MNRDYQISEMRVVLVTIQSRKDREHDNFPNPGHVYYMHADQVTNFVQATINLHHGAGNPHLDADKRRLDNLREIRIGTFNLKTDSFWWCARTRRLGDPNAAHINQYTTQRAWAHPDLLKREEQQEEMED